MLAAERRHRVLERVAEEQAIRVGDLAAELGVSEMTIRRDIAQLERDGFVRRTYGGAIAHVTRSLELAFNPRALRQAAAKRMIGIEAAVLIADVTTLFVGMGTTTEQFALFLPPHPGLTVITPSLPVASLLATREGRAVTLGGAVRNEEVSCYGPHTVAMARRYHADVAVLGAAGVSAQSGISELHDEDAELHRTMIEHSDRTVIVADSSKLGQVAQSLVVPLEQVDVLVTDASAKEDELEMIRGILGRVLVATPRPRAARASSRVS